MGQLFWSFLAVFLFLRFVHVYGQPSDCIITCVNGDCLGAEEGEEKCECRAGFIGENCDQDLDECQFDPCFHGTCTNLMGSYKCDCEKGYGGKLCNITLDFCAEKPCYNGECQSFIGGYKCSCYLGFYGERCETPVNPNCRCQNGGVCEEEHCQCPNSHYGEYCEYEKPDPCAQFPCGKRGYCLTNQQYDGFICKCKENFAGTYCNIPKCNGPDCEQYLVQCTSSTCYNQGECVDDFADKSVRCVCPIGYNGQYCELLNSTIDKRFVKNLNAKGSLIMVISGDMNIIQNNIDVILDKINGPKQLASLELDNYKQPMIYEWDPIDGKGKQLRINQMNKLNTDEGSQSIGYAHGVMLALNVDLSPCIVKNTASDNCYQTVTEFAAHLVDTQTQKVLEPLAIKIMAVKEKSTTNPASSLTFTIFIAVILLSVLLVVVLKVMTNFNKRFHSKASHGSFFGKLVGQTYFKRDRFTINTLGTWTPPKSIFDEPTLVLNHNLGDSCYHIYLEIAPKSNYRQALTLIQTIVKEIINQPEGFDFENIKTILKLYQENTGDRAIIIPANQATVIAWLPLAVNVCSEEVKPEVMRPPPNFENFILQPSTSAT